MNQIVWDRLARELKKAITTEGKAYRLMIQHHLNVAFKYGLSTQELES